MISTFSTLEAAIGVLPEYCEMHDQDVFVYRVVYPSGCEYSLRLRNQLLSFNKAINGSSGVIHFFWLPSDHKFKDSKKERAYEKAEREKIILERRLKKPVTIEPHFRLVKGQGAYTEKKFSHYTLEFEGKYKKRRKCSTSEA